MCVCVCVTDLFDQLRYTFLFSSHLFRLPNSVRMLFGARYFDFVRCCFACFVRMRNSHFVVEQFFKSCFFFYLSHLSNTYVCATHRVQNVSKFQVEIHFDESLHLTTADEIR